MNVTKTRIAVVAKLLLSAALVVLVLSKVQLDSVVAVLARADRWLVAFWYIFIPISIAISAWRWEILAPGLTYRTAMKYTWIGVFFGHVLPGSIAGDIAKGVSLALKDNNARAGLAASIVAEKAIGLAALLLFFDIACAIVYSMYGEQSSHIRHLAVLALLLSLASVMAAFAGMWVALRSQWFSPGPRQGRIARLAQGIGAAARFYSNKPSLVGKAFAVSLIIHLVNIFATWLSFLALRIDAGLLFAAIVYSVVSIIVLIPISISGIGVRDATLALLFTLFGLDPASGVALSWLVLMAVIPNVLVGGAIQLLEMYRKH